MKQKGFSVEGRASHGAAYVEPTADFPLRGAVRDLSDIVQQLGAPQRRNVRNAQVVEEGGTEAGNESSRRPQPCVAQLSERHFGCDVRGNCG